MPSVTRSSCTHDLGPGTTVCLRCRQEARERARARQQRMLLRAGLGMAALLVVGMGGAGAMSAWRSPSRLLAPEPLRLLGSTSVQQQGVPRQGAGGANIDGAPVAASVTPVPAATSVTSVAAATVTVPAPSVVSAAPPAARHLARSLALVVPAGRTDLTDSVYVERMADSAVVHFDTEIGRTRRRDKFEQMVRATLPALYGARADALLAALPAGGLTGGRELLTEVVAKGIRLPLADGDTLELWPETRPGRDGPLVVSYRARIIQ